MRLDCIAWCAIQLPQQLERAAWKPPPYLQPTNKALSPFHTWCVDLITSLPAGANGETILIVCVCVFSKWVEAAPLPNRSSRTTANWFHNSITCRYGVPKVVRSDLGREFQGKFSEYLTRIGTHHSLISVAHPRANGLVERVNKVIREGFRKMLAATSGGSWTDDLGDILAGIRMLPTRLGISPFALVYKQEVHWWPDSRGEPPDLGDLPEDLEAEEYLSELAAWWEKAQQVVRGKLDEND